MTPDQNHALSEINRHAEELTTEFESLLLSPGVGAVKVHAAMDSVKQAVKFVRESMGNLK